MKNKTILTAQTTDKATVECFFRRRGRGANNWQFLVDGFLELLSVFAKATGRHAEVDPDRSLGQGARIVLPENDYAWLRLRFARESYVKDAQSRGAFEFDEDPSVIDTVGRLRDQRRLRRANGRRKVAASRAG